MPQGIAAHQGWEKVGGAPPLCRQGRRRANAEAARKFRSDVTGTLKAPFDPRETGFQRHSDFRRWLGRLGCASFAAHQSQRNTAQFHSTPGFQKNSGATAMGITNGATTEHRQSSRSAREARAKHEARGGRRQSRGRRRGGGWARSRKLPVREIPAGYVGPGSRPRLVYAPPSGTCGLRARSGRQAPRDRSQARRQGRLGPAPGTIPALRGAPAKVRCGFRGPPAPAPAQGGAPAG